MPDAWGRTKRRHHRERPRTTRTDDLRHQRAQTPDVNLTPLGARGERPRRTADHRHHTRTAAVGTGRKRKQASGRRSLTLTRVAIGIDPPVVELTSAFVWHCDSAIVGGRAITRSPNSIVTLAECKLRKMT
jgi:hypothetical protein